MDYFNRMRKDFILKFTGTNLNCYFFLQIIFCCGFPANCLTRPSHASIRNLSSPKKFETTMHASIHFTGRLWLRNVLKKNCCGNDESDYGHGDQIRDGTVQVVVQMEVEVHRARQNEEGRNKDPSRAFHHCGSRLLRLHLLRHVPSQILHEMQDGFPFYQQREEKARGDRYGGPIGRAWNHCGREILRSRKDEQSHHVRSGNACML